MKTLQIEVETKKGCKMLTTWGVWQSHPYPDIEGHSGSFKWRNGGGLFGQFGNPPTGLANEYQAVLLREGWTPETAQNNRNDYAGFEWNDYGQPKQTLPGCIIFRGKSLGEMSAEIRADDAYVSFRVHECDYATESERAFLKEQITPSLLAFVRDNTVPLKVEVVQKITARFVSEIVDARKCIDILENEAGQVLTRL